MKTILEETQELMKEAINTITKLECVYEDLIKQRDNVKSNTLKQLLNTELWEYISFTETIIKYLQLYNRKKNKDLENTDTFFKNSIETVKTIKNKQMALNIDKCRFSSIWAFPFARADRVTPRRASPIRPARGGTG